MSKKNQKVEIQLVNSKGILEEPIIVQNDIVMISGRTIQSANFTKWIESLNTIKCVKKTTIIYFGKNATNDFVFTLKINLEAHAIE